MGYRSKGYPQTLPPASCPSNYSLSMKYTSIYSAGNCFCSQLGPENENKILPPTPPMVHLRKLYLQAVRWDLQVLADIIAIQHGPNALQVHLLVGQLPTFFQNCKRRSGHVSKAGCCGKAASVMAKRRSCSEVQGLINGRAGSKT